MCALHGPLQLTAFLGFFSALQVFWPLDDTWYEGTVFAFDSRSGKHQVHSAPHTCRARAKNGHWLLKQSTIYEEAAQANKMPLPCTPEAAPLPLSLLPLSALPTHFLTSCWTRL